MKRILLLCAMGMSTSLLVRKLEKQAEEEDYRCEIDACSAFDVDEFPKEPDLIVLGPQVRHRLEEFRDKYPKKKVIALDTVLYGMMDAKSILTIIRNELENKQE
ncbi:MAG: PTS sugar transporter subunit IIB [Clostridiaceae bacterium]|nr:PTS sugar transporter subunit IIB [Clostridiaceae bacterium]